MRRSRALLLDRDGVINRALVREGQPYPPTSANELEILPGVAEALARSRAAGFLNIVVSNQPDVTRRTQTRAAVEGMNRALMEALPIDDVFVCYHDDPDRCLCRKPLPGLLLQAAQTYDLDLSLCYVVGDRWRDIDAGRAAGCRTVLIDYGYNERPPLQPPDLLAGSLLEAVVRIEATLSVGPLAVSPWIFR
jgi:D-glycero-D-manno-heptose 1,7-bisphosphate phosphatase